MCHSTNSNSYQCHLSQQTTIVISLNSIASSLLHTTFLFLIWRIRMNDFHFHEHLLHPSIIPIRSFKITCKSDSHALAQFQDNTIIFSYLDSSTAYPHKSTSFFEIPLLSLGSLSFQCQLQFTKERHSIIPINWTEEFIQIVFVSFRVTENGWRSYSLRGDFWSEKCESWWKGIRKRLREWYFDWCVVTRFAATSVAYNMELLIDINTDIYPLKGNNTFSLALASTLYRDNRPDPGVYVDYSKEVMERSQRLVVAYVDGWLWILYVWKSVQVSIQR